MFVSLYNMAILPNGAILPRCLANAMVPRVLLDPFDHHQLERLARQLHRRWVSAIGAVDLLFLPTFFPPHTIRTYPVLVTLNNMGRYPSTYSMDWTFADPTEHDIKITLPQIQLRVTFS